MSSPIEEDDGTDLYRVQYLDMENGDLTVEWTWLTFDEIGSYRSDYPQVKIRMASDEELDLYEEAYADGYGAASAIEWESTYDGVTFRIELGEDGELDFEGTKMFECAVCKTHKDFEEEVGMAGGLFLGEVIDDKLWHVCFPCAQNAAMLKGIEDAIEEEES